jgi:MSHA biogenesis protein MshG
MPQYEYKGRDANGKAVTGVQDGANESVVADILGRSGVIPLQITLKKEYSGFSLDLDLGELFSGGIKLEDLVIFTRQMYSLTKAGIPIIRAISGLAETSHSKRLKHALLQVNEHLSGGRSLSSAMAEHPKVFSQLFASIVHVGENTGQLEQAFLQLSQYLELELDTRKRIKSAMRYPSFVLIALAGAMVILNVFVIPQFASMFAKFGAELPLMTRILIATSNAFVYYWPLMLLVCFGIIFGVRTVLKTEKGRLNWDRYKLRMPVVGSVIERALLARFARNFAMMLRAGVPMNQALSLSAGSADNAHMSKMIRGMRQGIEGGESLLRTATQSHLFTPLVLQMIGVGEETGQVDDLLTEVAEYYEREVDYDLKTLTARIEPILISIVAVMVLVLALGIFTPMWNMMDAVKGR